MFRIDASRVHAEMVDRLAGNQWTAVELPCDSVCPLLLPQVCSETHIEQAVAIRVDGPVPNPATVAGADLGLKAFPVGCRARSVWHPAKYTEFIGSQLVDHLKEKAA